MRSRVKRRHARGQSIPRNMTWEEVKANQCCSERESCMRFINVPLTQAELVESGTGSQVHHGATASIPLVLSILNQACLVSSRATIVEVRGETSYRVQNSFHHELGRVVVLLQIEVRVRQTQ